MFRTINDFSKSYETLTGGTIKLFDLLTDNNLNEPTGSGHRTVGQIGWHIVVTIPEMMSLTGCFRLSAVDHQAQPPNTAAEVIDGYRRVSSELGKAIAKDWTDKDLSTQDNMYGQNWERGFTLTALINHEIHHRAQMLMLLRQAGVKVPGLFGPAREEWTAFGKPEPPY